MDLRTRISLTIIGVTGLVVALCGFLLHSPAHQLGFTDAEIAAFVSPLQAAGQAGDPDQAQTSDRAQIQDQPSTSAQAAPAVETPAPAPDQASAAENACLHKGISVTVGRAKYRVSGPPALTLITGDGVDDEINFSTRSGLEKGCLLPAVTAKAIAMNFDAMDKDWGPAADWRADFCNRTPDEVTRFLCQGEDRAKGSPRQLALVALYDPKDFDGESMFRQDAPNLADFMAWRERLTKAGTPPPVQADGAFDVYPGGVWFERDSKGASPLLFSCDIDTWPVTGQHYCIGTLELDKGQRARVEFRTITGRVGTEALAAEAHLRALLAAWKGA